MKAVDLNGDALTYELVLKPEGMAIAGNGTVAWKPRADQVGSHRVVVRVSDGKGGIDLQTFDVLVQQGNREPIITSVLPTQKPQVGKEFQYRVTAQDLDGGTLSYELLSNPYQPVGVAIDPQTGLLKWTPTADQLGGVSVYGDFNELVAPWQVIVKVTDDKGSETYQSLDLIVDALQVNQAPVINSTPRKTTQLGSTYYYAIDATDPNGDQLTYSLVNPPAGMTIKDGLISWIPTAAQSGSNAVVVKVSDGTLTTTQTFNLLVTNQAPNYAPKISSTPTLVTSLEQAYSYDLKGSDPDGDLVLWSLEQAPEGMVIDARTGALRWQPLEAQIGEHIVAVKMVDSLGSYAVQEFVLQVNGVNTPPSIVSTPATKAAIGQSYTYLVEATDPEADMLRYMLGQHPQGMVINGVTGQISWTPVAGQVGRQDVEVQVMDAQGAVASQVYRIEVGSVAVNLAPTISSQPIFGADAGKKYQYQVVGNDPEHGALTYSLTTAPVGMVIDAVTGLITWNSPVIGNAQVVVKATDSSGLGVGQGYTLTTKQNHAPVINSIPQIKVVVGNSYRYDVVAQDVDGDALTYAIDDVSKGLGVSIDALGRISWKPNTANVGIHPVTVEVKDTLGAVATQVFGLEVVADNVAPTINLTKGTNIANIGDTVSFQVEAIDNVGISSRQLLVNNQAVILDPNGVGTYTVTAVGVVNVRAIVIDVNGNVSSSNTTLSVVDPTDVEAPIVSVQFPTDNITGIIDIIGSINDPNLAYYVLEVAPVGTEDYKEVFRGTSAVTNGVLGKFDPTSLVNDTYTLRLTAFDTTGHGTAIDQDVAVTGELKLGNFRLSFTDLAVPVTGIPITLTRTYDTLTSNRKDEFGYGWRMEFRDTDLRTSLKKDETYEQIGYRTVGFKEGDRVYITLPGGKREGFTFSPIQLGRYDNSFQDTVINGFLGGRIYKPTFEADKGNTTTLTVTGSKSNGSADTWLRKVISRPGEFVTMGGLLYRPDEQTLGNQYTVTAKDGTAYRINATSGKLESVKDTNGNTLTYTDTEISSSNGQKVVFERDNQGRIVSVTDPLGAKVKYEYDAKGDLVAVIDRDGNTTKYEYNSAQQHYLDKIIDPLGREAVKTEYDAQGRLKKTTNASGNGVELIYDPEHSIQVVKDALGNATTYEYDARGNVVTEVDALGGITRRTYDDENNLLSKTDAEGRTEIHTYDSANNEILERDALGNVRYYTYDSKGRLLTSIDELGNKTENIRDGNGNILTKIDANGSRTTYTYDVSGNKTSETDALGNTTTYAYNGRNKISEINALGHQINYKYDANGRETEVSQQVTFADGVRTITIKKTYDSEGNITSETDADGNIIRYQYNKNNKRILTTDALGRQTKEVYDDSDHLTKTIFADGLTTEFTYDAQGNRVSSKDRTGQATFYTYDALNRATSLVAPDSTPDNLNDNLRKLIAYDKTGRLTSLTDERGQTTTFDYDLVGNQIWTRSYDGTAPIITTATFDKARRRTSVTDALGHTTRYAYDNSGQLTSTIYADGLSDQTIYNALGKEIIKVDRAGKKTTYDYDALQHLIAVTLPIIDGVVSKTQYRYDERGLMISEIDALQHETKYEYDDRGLRTAVIRPGNQRSNTNYDIFGDVISYTDFNRVTTGYTYDNLRRLIAQQRDGQTIASYTYNANGQKATITDARGTTTYSYRPEGQLSQVLNPDGTYVKYAYEGAELRSVTTPFDTTAYSYDSQGRLKTVKAHGETTTYSYDLLGNQIGSALGNGVQENRVYDTLNRLIQVHQTSVSGQTLADYQYTLDAVGNRVKVVEKDRQVDFTYDVRDRLVKEVVTNTSGTKTTSYILDAVGNRLSKNDSVMGLTTYTYNVNDWLLTEVNGTQSTTYAYDANGNNTTKTSSNNGSTIYTWNGDNRLVGIGMNGHQFSYEYDLAGMRTAQTVDGVRTNYLLDVNRTNPVVVAEYSQPSTSTATYTYGGNLISQQQGSTESFFVPDGHSGVRMLTDSLGNIVSTSSYDAYGNVSSVGNDNSYLYRGEQFDQQTQLQYLRARYYDPNSGRFLGVDPIEGNPKSPTSRHRYLYGNANPITYSDPSGKVSMFDIGASLAIMNALIGPLYAVSIGSLNYLTRNNALDWNGFSITGSISGIFVGLPDQIAATASFADLKSDCYNGTIVNGSWLLLGVGISISPIPVSLTVSPSIKVTTPSIFGNEVSVLSGLFTSFGATGATSLVGATYSTIFMGLGYGTISGLNPANNLAYGFDFSYGEFTGLSIPLKSLKQNC